MSKAPSDPSLYSQSSPSLKGSPRLSHWSILALLLLLRDSQTPYPGLRSSPHSLTCLSPSLQSFPFMWASDPPSSLWEIPSTSLFWGPSFSAQGFAGRPGLPLTWWPFYPRMLFRFFPPRGSSSQTPLFCLASGEFICFSFPRCDVFVFCCFWSLPNSFIFSQTVKKQSGSRGPPLTPQGPDGGQRR